MQVTKGMWHMREQCVPGSPSSSPAQEPGHESTTVFGHSPKMLFYFISFASGNIHFKLCGEYLLGWVHSQLVRTFRHFISYVAIAVIILFFMKKRIMTSIQYVHTCTRPLFILLFDMSVSTVPKV